MGKLRKLLAIGLVAALVMGLCSLLADRRQLSEGLIRLHVVARSDRAEDQAVKLQVRDAVLKVLGGQLRGCTDQQQAHQWLSQNLDAVHQAAKTALAEAGMEQSVAVSLEKEAFERRDYESFSLPAGVYDSLRITLGEGQGENWWCVVFPSLCFAPGADFADTAAGAGFSQPLTDAVQRPDTQIRFFFLELLGRLQNWLYDR